MKVAGNPFGARRDDRPAARGEIIRVLIALGTMLALSAAVWFFRVPNPNIILMTGLVFFTSIYGFGAGLASAAVIVAYSMFFFSENNSWVEFSALNLQKLAVIALGALVNTLLIGDLKRKQTRTTRRLTEMNQLLRTDNHTLEEASLTDALTGVRNRFGLRRDYGQFESRYVHVMMMDLDGFKRINDTYGHAVGDFILKRVGQELSQCFGAKSCYRYGGDEFLIICVDMDKDVFPDRLNTLKQSLSGIYLNDKHLPARFSAGYVYGDCELSHDLRLMIHQADHNLYEAKEKGRDRWVGGAFSRTAAAEIERDDRAKEHRAMDLNDLFPT
ncbi:MAG: diguanylate cyclase [Clostridia bacterium]|nr:diguanylate cyclase [Clostridia bacterium]